MKKSNKIKFNVKQDPKLFRQEENSSLLLLTALQTIK